MLNLPLPDFGLISDTYLLRSRYKAAAEKMDGEVEFGAINCVDNEQICKNRWQVRSYPTLMMISPRYDMHAVWPNIPANAGKWADAIPTWARQTLQEWEQLERDGQLVLKLTDETFDAAVLESPELWIIMYHGGPNDLKSSENKVNFLRLATDMEGYGKLAMVDCSVKTATNAAGSQPFCGRQGVPGGNYPHFWVYSRCHEAFAADIARCERFAIFLSCHLDNVFS
jgi:hypothetical protein